MICASFCVCQPAGHNNLPGKMRGLTLIRAGLVAGCLCAGGGGQTPASPSPAGGGPSAPISDVAARLAVRVDGLETAVTIAGDSDVTFDASGSVGSGTLRYLVSYGDVLD
jgi:hypothetical protein